jgi:hypothetical protein
MPPWRTGSSASMPAQAFVYYPRGPGRFHGVPACCTPSLACDTLGGRPRRANPIPCRNPASVPVRELGGADYGPSPSLPSDSVPHPDYSSAMAMPDEYWTSYEHRVGNLAEFLEAVQRISAYQARTGTRFVWRGVGDAGWGLYSKLFRRYMEKHHSIPTEAELRRLEQEVLEEAREMGPGLARDGWTA